jgi:hypothetical protein
MESSQNDLRKKNNRKASYQSFVRSKNGAIWESTCKLFCPQIEREVLSSSRMRIVLHSKTTQDTFYHRKNGFWDSPMSRSQSKNPVWQVLYNMLCTCPVAPSIFSRLQSACFVPVLVEHFAFFQIKQLIANCIDNPRIHKPSSAISVLEQNDKHSIQK